MKRILSVIATVCVATVMLSAVVVSGYEGNYKPTVGENIISGNSTRSDFNDPVRVGYFTTFNDIIVDADSLNNKGYGFEVFQKISENSGIQFEFVPIEGSMIDAVKSGYVDVGGFMTRSDARREEVVYSENPYTKTYLALMSKDMDIAYGDVSAIDGKTVAVYDESLGIEILDEFCEENNISVNYVYDTAESYMGKEADFYVTYSEDPSALELNNVLNMGVYNLYLISNFENEQLMEALDDEYYKVINSEGSFFMELEEKYLGGHVEISHRGLTTKEIEILRQRPLEVGYVTGFAPLSYTNEKGEPDGALVEVLNSYAARYGFEVNYHPYSLDEPSAEYNGYDILLTMYGEGNSVYENYSVTDPYYEIPMYAVINHDAVETTVRSDILESDVKVGTLPYNTLDFKSFLSVSPNINLEYYTDWHELLDSFAAGNVDLLICTESATTYTEVYFDDMYTSTIPIDVSNPMRFFINKDISDEYVPIFNVIMDKYSDSDYEAIIETNANKILPNNQTGFFEFIAINWHYFLLMLLIIGLCFSAIHYRGKISRNEAIIESYNKDQLTGLLSIRKFSEIVDETLEKSKVGEYEVISFDIDMFKTINTHFSIEMGTSIIVAIGDALKKFFANTEAVVSRRAVDQFLIFRPLNEGGTIQEIYEEDILPAIQANLGEKYKISMSFGNAIVSEMKMKGTSLIGQADNARVAGKTLHKTTFVTFDEKMRKQYDEKIDITLRMEQALEEHEFFVEYQPKIEFDTLRIGGAEALVRWTPKDGGKKYPDAFIPVFEENGFIPHLDLYVLDEVCKFIKVNKEKMEMPRISVNLSAYTVLSDDIVARVADILKENVIEHELIELELTESAIETDSARFIETVHIFKELGLAISIDDFGAGVSSLNRISEIEADVLKLDKAFFGDEPGENKSSVVVTDVIHMAKHLNMRVVAEGVETEKQATWLKKLGCDYAQGYYFAKPMSEESFKKILIEEKVYKIG